MRACNGCRKRKIKCDAATTNTWPCSACTRLKLVCVPPTFAQDGDLSKEGQGVEHTPTDPGASASVNGSSQPTFPASQTYRDHDQATAGPESSFDGMRMFSQYVQAPQSEPAIYSDTRPSPIAMSHQSFQPLQMFAVPHPQPLGTTEHGMFAENEHSTAENLSEVLGELKIDETGIGMVTQSDRHCSG